ncbi:MAG: hypothetical protein IJC25_05130, partial [Clostridia bacterium]|nr:hypothetical protein [Clostridia bacterium]
LADVGTAGISADFGVKLSSDMAARTEKGDRKALTYLFNRICSTPDLGALTAALTAAEQSDEKDIDLSPQLAQLRDVLDEQRQELTQALAAWKTAVGICSTQVEQMAALFIELHDYM